MRGDGGGRERGKGARGRERKRERKSEKGARGELGKFYEKKIWSQNHFVAELLHIVLEERTQATHACLQRHAIV